MARHRNSLPVALALAAMVLAGPMAEAGEHSAGGIVVRNGWARASFGTAGAAYVTIRNFGPKSDRLIAAATPAARRAMIHEHVFSDGVAKMRHVMGLDVLPGRMVKFRPGGLHIMLMGLAAPLRQGGAFPLALTFRDAGKVEVRVHVLGPAAMGPDR